MAHNKNNPVIHTSSITQVCRTLYFFIGFYALSIIIFDAGNLITREVVVDRWTLVSLLLLVNTIIWFLASRKKSHTKSTYHGILTGVLAVALLVFAGNMTYWERGMASTSTILYILPLLVVATLKNRHALLATATLAAGTYAFSAVRYFNDFFNEGFRIQLWGSLLLYMGTIFVSAWILMIVANLRHDSE